jgi:3-methyl-2-oxobutanoate hydroxymethyltransferase
MMERIMITELQQRKRQQGKLTMLTAYDYPIAKLVDAAGVDIVLVGDSLGMVVLGYETTAPVTMEEMLHHAKAARRGVARALLIGDMPLAALQALPAEAAAQAKRFVNEAGCDGVKVEWRPGIEDTVRLIVTGGIPVMGHVGLTPQTASGEGGFGMRGTTAESAAHILEQARALEAAGCWSMVLECVPDALAEEITRQLSIPTVGIGSGPHCDGQVVVTYDLVGLFDRFTPKFVKRYADVSTTIREAAAAYVNDVRSGAFPGTAQTVTMAADELARFKEGIRN